MRTGTRMGALTGVLVAATFAAATPLSAESALSDGIAGLLREGRGIAERYAQSQPAPPRRPTGADGAPSSAPRFEPKPEPADPRRGDLAHEQAQRLMRAIDSILQDAATNRAGVRKLPSKNDFLVPPLWTETREDREAKISTLLDATLAIVTDVPVVEVQKRIETLKANIRDLDDRLVRLREKQLTAPKDGFMPGYVTDTVDSLKADMEDARRRIAQNQVEIANAKREVHEGLAKSGVNMTQKQVDLLLDGVLSGDLVRLVAVFDAAKAIDAQLASLMAQSGENVGAARRYFAMHAALFAMIVHAQDSVVGKIDGNYLPKLDAITRDIVAANRRTQDLLRSNNRPDQRRALEANRASQRLAEDAAKGYRRYLLQQREQVARARRKAAHDLRIADNTYETVEASYQLRQLMKDSATSFEAIQKLQAPTFEQIFKNEELRKEFENLTRKLEKPTS
ncbi:MAG: hypothetical protein ACK5JT_08175 [Hyphomicrobiaceae bacterium]